MAVRRCVGCLVAAVILVIGPAYAGPQLFDAILGAATPDPASAPTESVNATATKRADYAERLRVAQSKLEVDPADPIAAEEVTLYKTVETVFAQQEAVDQQIKDLEARKLELEQQLKDASVDNAAAIGSISFVAFDRLVNELAAEQARTELAKAKSKTAKAALDQAVADFDAKEQQRRQAQEAADIGKDTPEAAALAAAAERAVQASKVAADMVSLRQKEVTREKLADTVQKLTVEALTQNVERYRPYVVFPQADLDDQLKKLASQEERVRAALKSAEAALPKAQARINRSKADPGIAAGDPVATEELEAYRREKERLQDEINTYLVQLLQIDQLRTAWNRLFKVISSSSVPASEDLKAWTAETSATLQDLIGSSQGHVFRIEELRNELAKIADKADAAKEGSRLLANWIATQRQHVEAMIGVHEANLEAIAASRRLHGKLRTELNNGVKLLAPEEWARSFWGQIETVWNYEISSTEANGVVRVLTAGKILTVLAAFVAGLLLSRYFSRFFAHRLLRRFRLSRDATSIIRTLVFYALLVVITLTALHRLNVPLTAFTILGGALAIGFGFGSQALVNNFVSGLIMLAERPVRIGERIVFGRFDGVVEDVGFRCTRLRTGADHVVTIPNSSLVNDSIENIGRRRTIQRTMDLGITYDTPREKIAEAIEALRAILEEPGIREPIHPVIGWDKHPPKVFFTGFTPDSLNIQVVYTFAPPDALDFLDHSQRVNLRILEEFERIGVNFAFPSRTLYLANDSSRGLRMRVSSEDAA